MVERINFEEIENQIIIENKAKDIKFKKDLKKLCLKGIALFFFFILSLVVHEFIHAETLRYFGCEEVEYEFGMFVCSVKCVEGKEGFLAEEALAHSMIELVYYMGMFFLIFYLFIKAMFKDI